MPDTQPCDARAAQGAFAEENATFGFCSERMLLWAHGHANAPVTCHGMRTARHGQIIVMGRICGAALLLVGAMRLMIEKGTDEESQCYAIIAIGGGLLTVSVIAMLLGRRPVGGA